MKGVTMKRERLSVGGIILCAVLWQTATLAAGIEGRVYLDVNRNGQPDTQEPGVAHVAVSDGLRVAVTDAEGRYKLDTSGTSALVWVSVPRDHAAHGPFWQTAAGKSRLDFGLDASPQTDDFSFIQITDSHIGRADLLKQFAEHVGRLPIPIAFVINTGDLVSGVDVVLPEKAQWQYDRYIAAATFRMPLYNVPGNHEHVSHNVKEADPTHPFYGKGLYPRLLGPMHYAWDWAGVHCVALDGTTLPYQERLGTNQLTWLAADLKVQPAGKPILLFCHQSLPSLRDAKELSEILQGRNVLGAFCGHLHQTFATSFAGFPVYHSGALSGAWWGGPNIDGTPQGFRLVRIKGGALKTVFTNREGMCPVSIVSPLATSVQSGTFVAEVAAVDFGRPSELTASFCGQPVTLTQASREELWSFWRGTVDTRQAFDGARALEVTAKQGGTTNVFAIRYLVSNGRAEPFTADAAATLRLQVRGISAPDIVLLNGEPLGIIPASTSNETSLAFAIGKERLGRLNRVTVRAAAQGKGKDQFSIGPVALEYKGKRVHDLRYASFERHVIVGDDTARSEKDLYYSLP